MSNFESAKYETDGTRHCSLAELERQFTNLPLLPRDSGRLALIVCRRAPGVHEALDHVHLKVEEGVPGDEWNRRTPRNPDAQLTAMRRDIAELLGCGQPLTTSGENLIVELEISAANLPVGTRLSVGEAVVEVTPKPHNGCQKFARRFGEDALRFVQASATRHHNLRGIYWKVIVAGEARRGAQVEVLSRPVLSGSA